jgi:hypothetical protein
MMAERLMQNFDFYIEIRVSRTTETESGGIADVTGVIMGVSEGSVGPSYSVSIDGIGHMVAESDLTPTGRVFSRDDFYDGSSIKVTPQRYVDSEFEWSLDARRQDHSDLRGDEPDPAGRDGPPAAEGVNFAC